MRRWKPSSISPSARSSSTANGSRRPRMRCRSARPPPPSARHGPAPAEDALQTAPPAAPLHSRRRGALALLVHPFAPPLHSLGTAVDDLDGVVEIVQVAPEGVQDLLQRLERGALPA